MVAIAFVSPRCGAGTLTPSLRAYACSAASTCSTMASRSRPPPRGPLRSDGGAPRATPSSTAQAASTSAAMRRASALLSGCRSAAAETSGAPKSVVAVPGTRSTTAYSPGANAIPASAGTAAYRSACSASAASAVSSVLAVRDQPGQSTALAKARFSVASMITRTGRGRALMTVRIPTAWLTAMQ